MTIFIPPEAISTFNFAAKAIEPPDGCRSNHEVIVELARRVGAEHPAFSMTPREIIDWTLRESGYGDLATLEEERWLDLQPPFEEAHFLKGFGFPDRKFHFKPDWTHVPYANDGLRGDWRNMPTLPDHWAVNETADEVIPSSSRRRQPITSSIRPSPRRRRHSAGKTTGGADPSVRCGQARALARRCHAARQRPRPTRLHARFAENVKPGVLVSEGVWPPSAFLDGWGINVLVGDDCVAPFGGVAFHDVKVWARRA